MKGRLTIGIIFSTCFTIFGQQVILKSDAASSGSIGLPISNTPDKVKVDSNKDFEPTMFKSLNETIIQREHEVIMVGKMAPDGLNINELSLWGGYQKNLQQMEEDEAFLKDCDRNFENREKASLFFSDMGWQYLEEGHKEMATYRYNLAYLLNPDNTEIYWGLGVIEYQKGEHQEAIKLMSMGLEADDKNAPLLTDLATVYINCFSQNAHNTDLPKAYQLLNKAIELEPQYANAYMQLSYANFLDSNIDNAWDAFHKGYKISPTAINFDLLSQLIAVKPDPLGFFK
ncbi:hypothetical protein [uncultured Arcticibacterium sp.]|uniref:tetratricopeptide repeat protein n=1 Tax=uncultured Arcticibacterium sp. TaxID=2173042 RepID=UPI0030FB641C